MSGVHVNSFRVTRRRALQTISVGLTGLALPLLAACQPSSPTPAPAAAATPTAAPAASKPTAAATPTDAQAAPKPTGAPTTAPVRVEYWAENRFSGSHQVSVDAAQAWARANGHEIVTTEISSADIDQKVSAAIEANTLPDVMDMTELMLQRLTNLDKLVEVTDLYQKIGTAQGGWLKGIELAMDPKRYKPAKGYWAIPRSSSGNLLNWRRDILEQAGFSGPPETWHELADMSERAQKPGEYWGMGFSLAQEGDGNAMIQVMQSFGARVADDTGTTVTLNSPETIDFLKWVDDCYTNRQLFPPGVLTWDGSGDNNSYQAGQCIFLLNPGSVYRWMQTNDTELLAATGFGPLPAGPAMRVSPLSIAVRGIIANNKDVAVMESLIEHLTTPEVMAEWFKVDNNGPVLEGQKSMEAFNDPFFGGLVGVAENGSPSGYPDVANVAWSEFNSQFVAIKMIHRVLVDKWSPEQAAEEAHQVTAEIYAKNA